MGPVQRKTGYVIVALRAADDQLYYLRIATRNYIVKPPSCTFVDAQGRQRAAAWPEYDREGPFRPPIFICTPPTAEFYKYHDDHAYDPKTGTLVNTVCTIFTSLNDAAYCGRFAPPDGRMSDHLRLRLQRRFR